MALEPATWHHGLMARWWAEFTVAQPDELAFYRGAIDQFGQPALDLACGTGRLLLPLLGAGLDVDGADVSPDMLAQAARLATERGATPALYAQAMHDLDLPRRYRTIFVCDSFGLGASRSQDRQGLCRIFDHLEPGGALVFSHDLPYGEDDAGWLRSLPGRGGEYPRPWPAEGDRRRMTDGDELELFTRTFGFDGLQQTLTLEMRIRHWRDGRQVAEDRRHLTSNLYFAQELLLLLDEADFRDVRIEGRYTGAPATADDTRVLFVARRPS